MMLSLVRPARRGGLALLLGSSLVAPVSAQQALPPAREIVARHVAAIGGRDAVLAKRAVRTRGTFEMPAMGLKGSFDAGQSHNGAMFMRVEVPGLGAIASGFDGQVAWSTNPMMGPRLLQGAELAQIRDDAGLTSALREAPTVREVQTVGVSEVNGERCYRVRVSWASGRQTHDCYSVASGLLVGTEVAQLSPTGALDVKTTFTDYQEFDGIRMATVATQRAAGQEQVLRFTSVEFVELPAELFDPPVDVKTLMQRERGGSVR